MQGAKDEGVLTYYFRQPSEAEDGLVVDLFIEGSRVNTGRISVEMLGLLREQFAMDRTASAVELRKALLSNLDHKLCRIRLSELRETADRPLRFTSWYTYQGIEELQMGVAWCDVIEEATGPESAPEEVRHSIRREVLRRLTEPGTVARELVEMHDQR